MKDVFFTIIIKDTDNLAALDAVKRQSWNNYECFITHNHIKDLEKYIADDKRFHIVNFDLNTVLEQACGRYFIIINSDDILTPDALQNISKIAQLTDAPIIKYNTAHTKGGAALSLDEQKFVFNYLIRHDLIMQSVFHSLSGFCFARDIIQSHKINSSEHVFIMNMLKDVKSIAKTENIYLLQLAQAKKHTSVEYIEIIDTYKKIEKEFSNYFWHTYFQKIIPDLIMTTVSEHRRDAFVQCCKKIPLKFIPLKYKIMFFIMRIVSETRNKVCI